MLGYDLLIFALGLLAGAYGPRLIAGLLTRGETPAPTRVGLKQLLYEPPPAKNLRMVPRQGGRHDQRRTGHGTP